MPIEGALGLPHKLLGPCLLYPELFANPRIGLGETPVPQPVIGDEGLAAACVVELLCALSYQRNQFALQYSLLSRGNTLTAGRLEFNHCVDPYADLRMSPDLANPHSVISGYFACRLCPEPVWPLG